MKKILCFFLAIIMLFGLFGCSSQKEPEFSLGTVANNTYTNEFLGIRFTLPAEWVFYTEEQILEVNNIVGDAVDEEVAKRLENASIIYDMFATHPADGSNMNINLEKINPIQMATLDIKQTLEAQIDTIKEGYNNLGYADTTVEYQKIQVDGKDFDALKLASKIQGVDYYATVFTFKKGNYLASVTVGAPQADKIDTILSYFTIE